MTSGFRPEFTLSSFLKNTSVPPLLSAAARASSLCFLQTYSIVLQNILFTAEISSLCSLSCQSIINEAEIKVLLLNRKH